ncbi:hypothetical protein DSO57_1007231 [Entomophthora muscae]|uniref:Uncharacterized protein n=1 Tax=Entomophthora muscae TaxID=34485 RepID=A0ACC2TIC9_9FUNG|nr:hypothetical protein DSO57_1007231 [Entomophthora muscae]
MLAHLGLFAPILEKLASFMVKVAINSMSASWPTLYMLTPSDSSSNLPLQITLTAMILLSIFCYTNAGSKMLKPSSRIGILLLKQLTICLLYPHCLSLNHVSYHFTLTVTPEAICSISVAAFFNVGWSFFIFLCNTLKSSMSVQAFSLYSP